MIYCDFAFQYHTMSYLGGSAHHNHGSSINEWERRQRLSYDYRDDPTKDLMAMRTDEFLLQLIRLYRM